MTSWRDDGEHEGRQLDDDDIFGSYEDDLDTDEEEIISFLNEYYLIYPKRLPEAQLY